MMKLQVFVGTEKSEKLIPSYDNESGILSVSSESNHDWCFGCDIDGNIVFDLDADYALVNFDLHVHRRLWKKGGISFPPIKKMSGSLLFSEKTIMQKSFSFPLDLTYDIDKDRLRISIGDRCADKAVSLSDHCAALLYEDELVGFIVDL